MAVVLLAGISPPVAAQKLTPTSENVMQDLLDKGIPMEQIKVMMHDVEIRRGRGNRSRMEGRVRQRQVQWSGATCDGSVCTVKTPAIFLGTPVDRPESPQRRICGTINGRIHRC